MAEAGSATVVRFAPSPTGHLHVGNARIALANWLFAKKAGGRFILRHDDTDIARSHDRYLADIESDLRWLGLDWDDRVCQSERSGAHADAAARLRASGRLYACYETAGELSAQRKAQLDAGRPPVYGRGALELSAAQRADLESRGRRAHWRFRLDPGPVRWIDAVHGDMAIDPTALSDPVVMREDETPLYLFTSVVDDVAFRVTDIIRGDDHLTNTAAQIQMFAALGATSPAFAHLPLLTGPDGEPLSKRTGSLGLDSLRAEGIEPGAVCSLLARLGTSDPVEPHVRPAELAAGFDLGHISRAPARFDPDELRRVNAHVLRALPFESVRDRLAAAGVHDNAEAFWDAVCPNLFVFADVEAWQQVIAGPLAPAAGDTVLAARAADLLPAEPWTEATWADWTGSVGSATGARGKALFQPLRLALTARDHGPEMKKLLPLIGRNRALARLRGEAA